jgi:predicted RNase H-like HicB family nuclease
MPLLTDIKDYAIKIHWDGRAGYFVAEILEIPTCSADVRIKTALTPTTK